MSATPIDTAMPENYQEKHEVHQNKGFEPDGLPTNVSLGYMKFTL